MIRVFRGAGLIAAAVIAAPLAAADLTVVAKHTRDGKTQTTTSYIGSERIRMAMSADMEMIAELAKGEYTLIDNAKKEYSIITKQDLRDAAAHMKQAGEQMQAQMKQMEEQMKSLPPAMREKMKGMSGAMSAGVDVKKVPGKRTIAGYTCENWVISVGTISSVDQCLSTEVPLPETAWESYRDLADTFKSMGGQYFADMQEKTKDMKGYPLASTTTVSFGPKTSTESSEVTEIKKGALPAGAFDLPAGYKKKDSPFKSMKKK